MKTPSDKEIIKPSTQPQTGVQNAGLVIINSFVAMLFERLELTHNRAFINKESQIKAAQYLQYTVTGLRNNSNSSLPLNKVLCGLPITENVPDEIEINEAKEQLVNSLITAVIGYWPSIGKCSIDGFRGNWLVREGLLTELEDKWELTVDKRPYDILIHRSPFSFSVIKYPWMSKPLYVNWAY